MNNKEKYLKIVNERFEGKAKEILASQIEMFYVQENEIAKAKYELNEDIKLKKGTFIHGIFGGLENFDFIIKNGFIATNFTDEPRPNKIYSQFSS